jgi:Protein of unknown function (DUF2723)
VALLVFHLFVTPNVPGDKDAGEFAVVLAFFGAAHPTGYPLYTLAGGVFVHLLHALGAPWVWAANAFSALGAAVSGALLHALSARLLVRAGRTAREAGIGALLATAAFAVHPVWTAAASQAEVHTWHVAWTLGFLLVAWGLLDQGRTAAVASAPAMFGLGSWIGVGLAHHLTSVLTSGPLGLAILAPLLAGGRVKPRALALLLVGVLWPVTSYAFIAWRAFHPAPGQWGTLSPHWSSVLAHVTGHEYRLYVGRFAAGGAELDLIQRHVVPWLVAGLPLVAWWVVAARQTPAGFRWGIAGAIVAALVFVRFYGIPDPSAYLLSPLVMVLAVAPAAITLVPGAGAILRPLTLVATLAIVIEAFFGFRLVVDRNRAYRANETRVRTLWHGIPDRPGFVLWSDDMVSLLHGYQLLDGEKPRLEIDHPMQLTQDWPRARFITRHGFDPVSRAEVAAAATRTPPRDVEELARLVGDVITRRINSRSPLDVWVFEPDSGRVRRLVKDAPLDTSHAQAADSRPGM